MAYPELNQVLKPHCPIKVPGKRHRDGKVYLVPEPSVRLGLELIQLLTTEDAELTPYEERELLERLCGPVWDEWLDDRVQYSMMMFAGRTVLIYYGISPSKALDYASGGIDPTIPPRRKTRRPWWSWTIRRPAGTGRQTPAVVPG